MAVQAQHHPSNLLLLNRNIQPEKNPLGILDQSHMIFTNGVEINQRKRNREVYTGIEQINSFPFQTQPSQFIDLTQLHNSRPNVSTGLRLTFNDQNPDDFTTQIHQQTLEIDQFLQTQHEQLRRILEEKRKRHYRHLLAAAEETVAKRLREKEAEKDKAVRRNAELEAMAARLIGEAETWQARARARESEAACLKIQVQKAIMTATEDAESSYVDPDRVEENNVVARCKACGESVSSVVCLPCRHFCLCRECDSVARVCPVCFSLKSSSVEVYFN
ncbi:BOI-related E3 ubiquitin-protein ligase 1-like [Impatiens glandulifera]|uniref:BOI-related E3 ubiquitin-protein ligase 1-like n=1 Tax=Impatiens glandulifera TaxID=253017 RepID=UPI001FB0DBF7|nr:BOI-related E3 ubiquitin-protein ligase 1-like [Impatiens glandulifera]